MAGYDRLLADPEIDAVYIPLPNQLHFEWSMRALEAGKHVLCEKPLCLTSREVERLCAARDRAGKHIEEAFGYRNHAQWAKVLELIAGDAIGPVRAAHAVLAKQFLDPADVRNNPAAGGGALYDLGSYAINALNLVYGRPPLRVVGRGRARPAIRHRSSDERPPRLRRCSRLSDRRLAGGPGRMGDASAADSAGRTRLAAYEFPVRASSSDRMSHRTG